MFQLRGGAVPDVYVRRGGQAVQATARYRGQPDSVWPIDPATPIGVQPVGFSSGYTLTFSDEFATGTLDESKWLWHYPDTPRFQATTPGGIYTNTDEIQGYHSNGMSFDADGIVFTMIDQPHPIVPALIYTSGMICSYGNYDFLYGYMEAQMKLPLVNWAWPAFWTCCTDMTWPPEIDVFEVFGSQTWVKASYWSEVEGGNATVVAEVSSPVDRWHTYGALWEPGRVRWYYDGVLFFDHQHAAISSKPMYLLANLAAMHGTTNPADAPFSMKTRYIRTWSLPA